MAYPQLTFQHTTFHLSSFISRKRAVVFQNTIPYQLHVLKECGTYDAFKLKWRDSYQKDPNSWIPKDFHLFWDSDIGKWIEGACYALLDRRVKIDAEGLGVESSLESDEWSGIERAVQELVEMMETAQMEDGYLNIHYQMVELENRFTNLRDMHELYNAGHLIEAAIAHQQYFRNDKLITILIRYVDLLHATFGPQNSQIHGYPGHPEIELALLRLHSITQNPKHLELATYFITERGSAKGADGVHFYDWEAKKRGERPYERPDHYPMKRDYWYQQAGVPICEQEKVEGHSVRAMYLYTGVADYQRQKEGGKLSLVNAESLDYAASLKRLWRNMVEKRMYLTGGVGAMHQWEGFGADYFLPQGLDEGGCYAETCAAIGVMMFAQRMLQLDLDSKYADVMELCFFNAVLGGMSCDGKTFAYENALASCDARPCTREKWFTCACCPPNVSRLLGSIGGYIWDYQVLDDENSVFVNVHMFTSTTLTLNLGDATVNISQELDTHDLPWGNSVKFVIKVPENIRINFKIRIPSWTDGWKVTPDINEAKITAGYLELDSSWLSSHPSFEFTLDTKVRFLAPHPFTNQNTITIAKGPLIYCLEDVDNPWVTDHFKTLIFDHSIAEISESLKIDEETSEAYTAISAKGGISFLEEQVVEGGQVGLPVTDLQRRELARIDSLVFVPFYFRANRGGKGHMRVGIRRP